MSTLLVVRHGQASFGAADYDQLSELGGTQSQLLGGHLSAQDIAIDAVYCGPAKRHRQTLENMISGSTTLLPEATILEGLAEFPAFELVDLHGQDTTSFDAFEQITSKWMHGTLDTAHLETAKQFEARVASSLSTIAAEQGRGKTVLVVTSGGPMMATMKSALSLNPAKASDLLWVIANSSLSEFRYRDNKLSLIAFNQLAHLATEHITYR